jgi:hypothetical protein
VATSNPTAGVFPTAEAGSSRVQRITLEGVGSPEATDWGNLGVAAAWAVQSSRSPAIQGVTAMSSEEWRQGSFIQMSGKPSGNNLTTSMRQCGDNSSLRKRCGHNINNLRLPTAVGSENETQPMDYQPGM